MQPPHCLTELTSSLAGAGGVSLSNGLHVHVLRPREGTRVPGGLGSVCLVPSGTPSASFALSPQCRAGARNQARVQEVSVGQLGRWQKAGDPGDEHLIGPVSPCKRGEEASLSNTGRQINGGGPKPRARQMIPFFVECR